MKLTLLLALTLSSLAFSSVSSAQEFGAHSQLGDVISSGQDRCMHNIKILQEENLSGPLMEARARYMCEQAMKDDLKPEQWIYSVESNVERVINCFVCEQFLFGPK